MGRGDTVGEHLTGGRRPIAPRVRVTPNPRQGAVLMGARTGQEYVERLSQTRPAVEINGERVAGPVTEHPALSGVVRSYAELYDLQHQPDLRDVLTYESPTSGE